MAERVDSLVAAVAAWEGVTVEPHRFGGQEFRLARVEIGHVHRGGLVDVPFTRQIREQLVSEDLALPHHILPESGWISFYMRSDADLQRAEWLLRLSYLQKHLRHARQDSARQQALIADLDQLAPSPALRALLA